jgi:hypothetical protein
MVEITFDIRGDNIFDVGLRAGLIGKAGDYNIKLHTTNIINDNKVRVIAIGSSHNIYDFHEYVSKNDVRADKIGSMYDVTHIQEHDAADINFTNYHESFSNEQQGKTRVIAKNMLSTIKQNGEQSEKKLSAIEQQLELMRDALEGIGNTLRNIDKNTSKA